ncbi:MAG: LacI family DNA-binding transcriptional regulator [Anaerolineae bacterium]|nr:LacI family DNA-binding transcriptional regulator [Anaerolineae bacterium]
MGRAVTIKDVAREAGVSIATVSNVLNGRTDSMSEETQQRVLQVMEALRYRPNALARGLVTQHTATIGVVVAEIETPLFLQALNTIEPIARDAGYNVLMSNARNSDEEQEVVQVLLEKRVDGFIFLSVSEMIDDDWMPELERLRIPTVLVNRARRYPGLDQIDWDDVGGVSQAVDHLVALGHRRIGHLCGPRRRRSGARRLRGYKRALVRHGISYQERYVCPGDYTAEPASWCQSTRALMQAAPPPTAIVASDDIVAAMAIKTVQQMGMRVPQDVAVIGVDDQHFCTYLNPALTTVRLPVREAGRRAVEIILDRVAGQHDPPEHILLPCSLIVRESCGAPLV